jgi:hypothetical protein
MQARQVKMRAANVSVNRVKASSEIKPQDPLFEV